jgi:hypothetical protein
MLVAALDLPAPAPDNPLSLRGRFVRSPRPRSRCRRRGDRRFGAAQRFDDAARPCIVPRIFSTRFDMYNPQVIADYFVASTKFQQ